jgi:toxin FitB
MTTARLAGNFCAKRTKGGLGYSMPYMLIAGVAAEEGAVLVTRNARDFLGLPIEVLNPWEEEI